MITGTSGRSARTFGSISSPLMPGMLMSDRIRISEGSATLRRAQQGRGRRRGELHLKASGLYVAPELLAKQGFDIGLVIDDEYVHAQFLPPVYCA